MVKKPSTPEHAPPPASAPQAAPQSDPAYSPPPPPPPPSTPQGRSNGNGWTPPYSAAPQSASGTWPIPGDVPDLDAIIKAQAATIADQAALIDGYQADLAKAQAATPPGLASANGVATGTSVVLTNVVGIVNIGAVIAGTGVPAGTTVTGQSVGTAGGNGTYSTSVATTANGPVTFTTPIAVSTALGTSTGTTTLALANNTGVILLGSSLAGANVPAGTTLLSQQTGVPGGAGNYTTNNSTTINGTAVAITPPAPTPSTWPTPTDAVTLNLLVQQQTAVLRVQTALLSHYQDVLNTSQTPAP
ncbi:MAG TPA: hypothetical protein VHT52_20800, partial [Stellaceae bacterium]|nr:hypothetical protein [Stellaceae bacterium]